MKKLKILGMGNLAERSYFVFEKKLDFFPLFSLFLEKIKMEKSRSFYLFDEGELDLDELTDSVENLRNPGFDIELFFGDKRIVAVVRTGVSWKSCLKMMREIADL